MRIWICSFDRDRSVESGSWSCSWRGVLEKGLEGFGQSYFQQGGQGNAASKMGDLRVLQYGDKGLSPTR